MIEIPGYTVFKQLIKINNSILYRAVRLSDNRSVILKYLNLEYPTKKQLLRYRQEFDILKNIDSENIIKVYDLIHYKNRMIITIEDLDGLPLSLVLKKNKLSLEEKIFLSIKISSAIFQVHQNSIIHKDINPSNFIWNKDFDKFAIIGFSIATELSHENMFLGNNSILEGSLNYISPEQTGRIKQSVDYRTDLYSFGVTLYEVFTGILPFTGEDEIELIYSHIAKSPIPPCEIDNEIPEVISDIIMKLLVKNPEERYQTILSVKRDLEHCLKELKSKKNIENFIIAQNDISERFRMPQKLYGRRKEISIVLDSIEKVKNGSMEILLISGFSGVGKSSIAREIQKSIIRLNGNFISGKCNDREKNIPYLVLIEIFNNITNQLLLKSDSRLDNIKTELVNSLGLNIRILVDLFPRMEEIFGPQKKPEKLNPQETQNRFHKVVKEFIKFFTNNSEPMVLFLDDLQWCDFSTLEIIKYLSEADELNHLLIIGTYRDNEVSSKHKLTLTINKMKSNKTRISSIKEIHLEPLNKNDVNLLIADTLKQDPKITLPLTDIVFQKTKGNPFYINQLLNSLYHRKIFKFNNNLGQWQWDIEKVKYEKVTNNVIDFIILNLDKLTFQDKKILQYASCIGNKFSLKILSIVTGKPFETLAHTLLKALKQDIIFSLTHNYNLLKSGMEEKILTDIDMIFIFYHDRIRQAIYSLIPESQIPATHLKVGRLLRKYLSDEQTEIHIFNLTNHYNIGKELINTEKEKLLLANLNYKAGKTAKKSSAYAEAAEYFKNVKELMSPGKWSLKEVSFFKLSLEYIEAIYISGSAEKARGLCEELYKIVKDKIDMASLIFLESRILEFTGEQRELILEKLKTGLRLFDINLPEEPEEINSKVQDGMEYLLTTIKDIPVSKFSKLPDAKDKNIIMAINFLFYSIPITVQINFPLFLYLELALFKLAVKYGITEVYCKIFADFGIITGSILNNYKLAYKFGETAFKLIERYNANSMRSSVYFIFSTFLSHWRVHYKEALNYYDLSISTGIETGDFQNSAYACAHKLFRLLCVGSNLSGFEEENKNEISHIHEVKATILELQVKIIIHFVNKFRNSYATSKECTKMEKMLLNKITELNHIFFQCIFGQLNTIYYYLMNDFKNAEKWNKHAEKYIEGGIGHFSHPDHILFQSLLFINKSGKLPKIKKNDIEKQITKNLEKLKIWADNCPENFSHKYYLVSAKYAIMKSQSLETVINLFKKARNSIKPNEFLYINALINELEGEYWFKKGQEKIGQIFIQEAHYFYYKWGGDKKVAHLESRYSHFLTNYTHYNNKFFQHTCFENLENKSFDIAAIIKSMQVISSEIRIDKLLKTLMQIIIKNAGAEHGAILLKKEADNNFYIVASKRSESDQIDVMKSVLFTESNQLCKNIVCYVLRTKKSLVLNNACKEFEFQNYDYIKKNKIKSVLCTPIIYKKELKGILYLENNLSENVFTPDRLELVNILSSQISISIENAYLYENLEEKVTERTSQLNNANKKLKQLSLQDPLTRLYNRRYLYEHVSEMSQYFLKEKFKVQYNKEKRKNFNTVMGIFLLDLDFFKKVNDTYGHKAGDEILVAVSRILKQSIRSDDYVLRWGGEEFLIILNNTNVSFLKIFSQKILKQIRETPIKTTNNKIIFLTISVGCTCMPFCINSPKFLNLEQTINISDYALYMAKESGRDRAIYLECTKNEVDQSFINYITSISKDSKLEKKYFKIEIYK